MKHTPTPWEVYDNGDKSHSISIWQSAEIAAYAAGPQIARLQHWDLASHKECAKRNAAFIVWACNNAEGLVRALNGAREILLTLPDDENVRPVLFDVEAALAKAGVR